MTLHNEKSWWYWTSGNNDNNWAKWNGPNIHKMSCPLPWENVDSKYHIQHEGKLMEN